MPSLQATSRQKTEETKQQQQEKQRNGSKNKTKQRPDLGQCKGRAIHTHTHTDRGERTVETIISQRQPITARVFCTKRESESVRERE